jgi:enoyl-CoA hydratase
MNDQLVRIEKKGRIGIMTVNRPATMNALNTPMLNALEDAIGALERDDEVRVIVITGAGEKAFVAGGDIAELNSRRGLAHYVEFGEDVERVFRRFETCDKTTIAAVNGWALGGGMELLLTLDIRILADHVKVGLPEIKLGLFPGGGGSQRLMRQIPLCRAKEIMFTGEPITAAEAVTVGVANRSVPKDKLMAETMALAEKIAEKSPLVLKFLKRSMLHGFDMPLAAALPFEQALISLVFDSDDAHEGCFAFVEKRRAEFKGR